MLCCEGHRDVDLTIWQDSADGSRREDEFTGAATKVHAFVIDFISEHGRSFRTLDYRLNERNLGPYGTCKVALDHAFSKHEFAILIEDDILLSSDALSWFDKVYRLGLLQDGRNWAIAGQSIFFDSRGRDVDQEFVATASRLALEENLVNKFTVHQFVPSACFATTRRWWAEFRSTRGEPRGDVLLCNRTKEEGWGCVFPIVPRAKDVGMLHDYGFSVTIHSKDGVQAITTPYLTSEDLLSERPVRPSDLEQFEGDAGLLFRQTTLLEGYSPGKKAREQVATAASDAKDWGRAAAVWNALREEFPEEPRYWLRAGEAFCEARMIEPAERLLDEAVRLFPQHKCDMSGSRTKPGNGARLLRDRSGCGRSLRNSGRAGSPGLMLWRCCAGETRLRISLFGRSAGFLTSSGPIIGWRDSGPTAILKVHFTFGPSLLVDFPKSRLPRPRSNQHLAKRPRVRRSSIHHPARWTDDFRTGYLQGCQPADRAHQRLYRRPAVVAPFLPLLSNSNSRVAPRVRETTSVRFLTFIFLMILRTCTLTVLSLNFSS